MINPTDAYVSTQQPQPQVTNVNVFNHPEMGGQGGVATDKKHKQAKHHNRFVFVYCMYNICACAHVGELADARIASALQICPASHTIYIPTIRRYFQDAGGHGGGRHGRGGPCGGAR